MDPLVPTEAGYGRTFRDSELVYSATSCCLCGAGLAYPRRAHPGSGAWDCSDILTGRAVKQGEPGAKRHDGPAPFAFYKVLSELQPSAALRTTRPGGVSLLARQRAKRDTALCVVAVLVVAAALLLAKAFVW